MSAAGPQHDDETAQLPEELPPVQPPSAGFIIQLFVVPGLIVAAIVGVWLLFGRLAVPDADWRSQLVELQHHNEHRRWRGALGLSQMLAADEKLGDQGQHLAQNAEIAQALTDVLTSELKRGSQEESDLKIEAFLARTLGLFDLPDVVLPALKLAADPQSDREVRKNAIGSLSVMSHRMQTSGRPLPASSLIEELSTLSSDNDELIRQLCAYGLGLFDEPAARDRLEVMLQDSDKATQVNAAIGLARHGHPQGAPVFIDVLKRAGQQAETGSTSEYTQFATLQNSLVAIERLASNFSGATREELVGLIRPIAETYREPKIRITARTTLAALEAR